MNEWVSIGANEHVHDLLSEYLNDDLPSDGRQRVEQHLNDCAECRRDFQSLRASVQLVRQLPPRPVPRSFVIPASDSQQARRLVWLRLSTSALAACFIALLALQVILPSAVRVPSAAPVAELASGATQSASPASSAAAPMAPAVAPQATNQAPVSRPTTAPAATDAGAPARDFAAAAAAPTAAAAPAAPLAGAARVTASTAQKAAPAANASAGQTAAASEAATEPESTQGPPTTSATQVQTHPAVASPPPTEPVLASWYVPALVVLGVLTVLSLGSLVVIGR